MQDRPGPIIYGPPRAPRIAKNAHFLSRPGGIATLRDSVCVRVCVCVMSGKNVKVFELTIFLSYTMNMVTQIIYLGRMEVEDWYYAVCFYNIFLIGFTAVWT